MSTREQRAADWLEWSERRIDGAQQGLKALQGERDRTRGSLQYAWDIVSGDVLGLVNVDSGRLLRAVQATLALASGNETVNAEELREAVNKCLLGEDRW